MIALACGYTVDCILLWPLGGLALIGKSDRGTPLADLKVAVAGPLTHVPQLVVFAALAAVYGEVWPLPAGASMPAGWLTLELPQIPSPVLSPHTPSPLSETLK